MSASATSSCTWTFRPSALLGASYKNMTVDRLLELYAADNQRAAAQQQKQHPGSSSCAPPPRATTCKLRTCQWNLNYFSHARYNMHSWSPAGTTSSSTTSLDDEEVETRVAQAVAQTLQETNADVIVLHEFGIDQQHQQPAVVQLTAWLEQAGYQVCMARCSYPTVRAWLFLLRGFLVFIRSRTTYLVSMLLLCTPVLFLLFMFPCLFAY